MSVNRKWITILVLTLFIGTYAMVPSPVAAQAVASHGSLPVAVSGNFSQSSTAGPLSNLGTPAGTFNGTFYIQKFLPGTSGGTATAVGTLVGTVNGQAVTLTGVTAPVNVTDPACPILSLHIGPINLDLLGLVITTNAIDLNITAQSGPGNLLGNLLCSVANLLNNPSPLANLLNQIIGALGL
jgi:hypothetical protein